MDKFLSVTIMLLITMTSGAAPISPINNNTYNNSTAVPTGTGTPTPGASSTNMGPNSDTVTSGAITNITPGFSSDYDLDRNVRNDLNSLTANGAKNISVSSFNGVVTLQGSVRSQADADALMTQARSTAGVTQVINKITVDSNATY